MPALSVISGAASQDSLQALVIVQGDPNPPRCSVQLLGAGVAQLTRCEAPETNAKVRAALAAVGAAVYRIAVQVIGGAAEGSQVLIDVAAAGEQQRLSLWTLPAELPQNEGLRFVVASCYYREFKRGDALRAALQRALPSSRPGFQLWVGDNVYLDIPGFSSAVAPHAQTLERYLQYLLTDSYRFARALHPTFTTYDDHEFWNDYPESQAWLPRTHGNQHGLYKQAALDLLDLFQSGLNPRDVPGSRAYQFDIKPVSFFVADTRSSREGAEGGSPKLMPEADLDRLCDWADGLKGPGILVLGQPLWIEPTAQSIFGTGDHNPPFFRAQYERIWRALREADYDVLVLSGDVHHSRFLKITMMDAPLRPVFELVSSPAAHIPSTLGTIERFLGFSPDQGHSSLELPGQVAGSAQRLKASYLFGTDVQNTFAVVTLRALGDSVRVGVSFRDYLGGPVAKARSQNILPTFGQHYDECIETSVCVLRQR